MAHALALVIGTFLHADLEIGSTQQRIKKAGLHLQDLARIILCAGSRATPAVALVDFLGLPGAKALCDLLWKTGRIGRGAKGLFSNQAGRLMVLSTACSGTRKGGDDLGSKGAYHPDHVLEDFLFTPFVQGFSHVKGVTKIVGAGKKLAGSIVSMHGHQFLGPKDSQCFKQFRTNFILTSTPSGEGKKTRAVAATAAEHDKKRIVFIVGMGGDHEKASRGG